MAHRLIVSLVVAAGVLAAAPAARATLVYVKQPNGTTPEVWSARDDGTGARRVGEGSFPVISPDGQWVAWRDTAHDTVLLRKLGGRNVRRIARSLTVGTIAFSPDSARLGVGLRGRLLVHHIASRESTTVAHGYVNGFSFSPDSAWLAYGTTGRSEAYDAASDLYVVALDSDGKTRITRDRKSLNPLWGPAGDIVFDRQTPRAGDAPQYNLFAIHPDGGAMRRLTSLKIPTLLSGLIPVDWSADGTRLLAEFVGQDTSVGFAVDPANGETRALSKNMETGFVASALSADGRTVLGMTGGADPANRHDVVTVPWGGGKPTVLVRRAALPDWTR
jgi:Tol biopolymer transport system component